MEAWIAQLERELARLAKLSPACTTLLSIPGIGLLTATALVAATSGDVSHFQDARHFSKLARICYATLRDKEPFDEPTVRLTKKINRESFVMPA